MESTVADTRTTRSTRSGMAGCSSKDRTDPIRRRKRLVHKYGNVPEQVGKVYRSRTDLQVVHHPTTNWIHIGPEGPYSIIIHSNKRFIDEGEFVVLSVAETRRRSTGFKKNCIEENLLKAVRSLLPIRIIRVIKKGSGAPATFRYDGLYRIKKRITIYGKLKFILSREKNQPELQCNWERKTTQISYMLRLFKKFRQPKQRSIFIKKEENTDDFEKEENTDDFEKGEKTDDSQREVTSYWVKKEIVPPNDFEENVALAGDEDYVSDWQQSANVDNLEIVNNSLNYSPFCQKIESNIYLGEGMTLDEECGQNFLNDNDNENENINTLPEHDCINNDNENINTLPEYQSENNENENINTLQPEYNGVNEENRVVTSCILFTETPNETSVCSGEEVVDPLQVSDPLEGSNDENKTCNFSDRSRTSSDSEEIKSCDEKKSGVIDAMNCEKNVDYEGKLNNAFLHEPCIYSLTLADIVAFINGTNNQDCPCKMTRCNGQLQFETAFKSIINEQGVRALEKNEEKINNSLDTFFMQLAASFQIKKKSVCSNRKIKTNGKSPRKLHVKKLVTIEESLVTQMIPSCPTPLREEVIISENTNFSKERQRQLEVDDVQTSSSPQKRRKKRKACEAASLGPVIESNDDNTPRSSKGRKLTYAPGKLTVSQNRRKRSSRNHPRGSLEEPNGFIGFVGPIKPSNKIKIIQTYIKKLSRSFF